jgi:phosphoenolpyruvate carboxylase
MDTTVQEMASNEHFFTEMISKQRITMAKCMPTTASSFQSDVYNHNS